MPELNLTDAETAILAGYINQENDGIDMYPGDLDPAALMAAANEIERLEQNGGRGVISPASASLAADVLSFFLGSFRTMMPTGEAEVTESVVSKLRALAAEAG